MLFDIDLLSSCSGRSSIFKGPKREDLLLLEVIAETGLWYGLIWLAKYFECMKYLMRLLHLEIYCFIKLPDFPTFRYIYSFFREILSSSMEPPRFPCIYFQIMQWPVSRFWWIRISSTWDLHCFGSVCWLYWELLFI